MMDNQAAATATLFSSSFPAAAAVPSFFSEDDTTWGEFNFISYPPPPHQQQQQQVEDQEDDDDDWGDFIDVGSQPQTPTTPSVPDPVSNTTFNWAKPQAGPIPLSVFGDQESIEQEEEEQRPQLPPVKTELLHPSSKWTKVRDVKDLIADLYKENKEEDDENGWEFKDAFSPVAAAAPPHNNNNGIQQANYYINNGNGFVDDKLLEFKDPISQNAVSSGSLVQQKTPDGAAEVFMPTDKFQGSSNVWESDFVELRAPSYPTVNGSYLAELSPNSVFMNGDIFSDDIEWDFQKASDASISDHNSACEINEDLSHKPSQNSCSDLYLKLKNESICMIVHHLGDLKESGRVAILSGEQDKVSEISKEIEALKKKLQEANISENVYMEKNSLQDAHVSQLSEVIKEPHLQAFVQEYQLSERILSAEKHWSAAIELFGHATSVLHIMGLASREEQQAYIIAWSKLALACAKELQEGALIWTESRVANVSKEILSKGNRYFAALGEIYRVSEILRASCKLYKPWVLSIQENCSSELVICLEKCVEAWTTSCLSEAVGSISAGATDVGMKALEYIKLVTDLDKLIVQNASFGHNTMICRLSLLPMGKLQDVQSVTWNGDQFFLKLANLWANRVSCNPPHLPRIHVG